jgi:arabinogalactan oligomer / maltooligosaccharide transport system permease protein
MKFISKNLWVHVILIGACFISLFPLLRILGVSLRQGDKLFSTDFEIFPETLHFGSYSEVIHGTEFFMWLFNSTIITLLTSFIGVTLSATAAYALSRYKFKMKGKILLFLMATQMMPAVMLLLPLYFMISRLQLIDTYAGVVIAYSMTTLPFCTWLLKGYFDGSDFSGTGRTG